MGALDSVYLSPANWLGYSVANCNCLVKKAKVAYLQANRVRRADDASLAGELLSTIFNERTMQYQADHESQIEAATVESVNAAIRKFIVPDKLVSAAAGDFAAAAQDADGK